jgi:hypothetical protein
VAAQLAASQEGLSSVSDSFMFMGVGEIIFLFRQGQEIFISSTAPKTALEPTLT